MTEKMRAIGLYKYLPITEKESLVEEQIEKPKAQGRKMVVKVEAISVNPVDTKLRSPKEKVETKLRVLGGDVAGVVAEVTNEIKNFKVGDKVFYSGNVLGVGANSEFHLIDERLVGKKPSNLSMEDAAGFPLVSLTAYESLFERLLIESKDAGKAILIIAGSGGVGSVAIQLAKKAGLKVIATASRPETVEWCKEMGADFVIDHAKELKPQIEALGFKYMDYILCLNNTDKYFNQMAEIIAPFGKINSIVEAKGPLEIGRLFLKCATFSFEFMSTASEFQTNMERQGEILNEIAKLIENGTLKNIVTTRLGKISVENLKKAHAMLEGGKTIGKVTLAGW